MREPSKTAFAGVLEANTGTESSMTRYISKYLASFSSKEDGTTTTEYALMIALILVFCLAALLSTGDVQQVIWFDTADSIEAAIVP